MLLRHYLEKLNYDDIPSFLIKYLSTPSLKRLKKVGYFCGMDYASKDIYDFSEYISRFDHSLTVSLITYKLTKDKRATIAGLFHDVATPCFSHVIDYMNKDYENQESTEEFTEQILKNDLYLRKCLEIDGIDVEEIINFKKYSIVDNDRPKLCADRLDGVILTGIGWTKNISQLDIDNIVDDILILKNEFNEDEIGFKTMSTAEKVIQVSKSIDHYCHSKEDNYMMELLADITRLAIANKFITYHDLFTYNENDLMDLFNEKSDTNFRRRILEFRNIRKEKIPNMSLPKVKVRRLNPIVNGRRML